PSLLQTAVSVNDPTLASVLDCPGKAVNGAMKPGVVAPPIRCCRAGLVARLAPLPAARAVPPTTPPATKATATNNSARRRIKLTITYSSHRGKNHLSHLAQHALTGSFRSAPDAVNYAADSDRIFAANIASARRVPSRRRELSRPLSQALSLDPGSKGRWPPDTAPARRRCTRPARRR